MKPSSPGLWGGGVFFVFFLLSHFNCCNLFMQFLWVFLISSWMILCFQEFINKKRFYQFCPEYRPILSAYRFSQYFLTISCISLCHLLLHFHFWFYIGHFSFSWWVWLMACQCFLSFQRTCSWFHWSFVLFLGSVCLFLLWSLLGLYLYSLWALFIVPSEGSWNVNLDCLFEIFLISWDRPVMLWISLLGPLLLCPVDMVLLYFHFHLFQGIFLFLSWSHVSSFIVW